MIHDTSDRRTVLVVCVAALAVLGGCAGMGGDRARSDGAQGGSAQVASSGDDAGGGASAGVGSYYTDDGDRVVVRESNMDLRVENFSHSFQRLRAVAADNGGYLGDRSQTSQGEWDSGRITVRVPPERFADARDAIASLGHVESEDVRVKDFTSEYDDRQERIRQLETEERELERLLNETDDVDEADRVRDDLRSVREERRSLRSQQQSLQQRESMSTIHVYVHEPESERPPANYESAFGFYDAFLEAFYGGLTALKYVIVFFGYVVPVGLALIPLGAFGVGVVAGWRRATGFVRSVLSRDDGSSGTPSPDSGGPDDSTPDTDEPTGESDDDAEAEP